MPPRTQEQERAAKDSPVKAARRVVELLEALEPLPEGLTLSELAVRVGIPKSTALRYLQTLEEAGWVEREADNGRYLLGLGVPTPAQLLARLARAARPALVRLNTRFQENALFGIFDRDRVLNLDVVPSPHSLRLIAEPGTRNHLHSTAMGKAIASTMSDETIRRLLSVTSMPALTDRTITDPDHFIDELAAVRRRGYATADGEHDPAARTVAVPVQTSRAPCALAVTAPAIRLAVDAMEDIAVALKREAAELERTLG